MSEPDWRARAEALAAVLREVVGQAQPNRWGYDAAQIALNDDWRARARAELAKMEPHSADPA